MTSLIDDVETKVAQGAPITVDDAVALWGCHDLVRLGMLGDEARRRRHGDRATYVRVHEVKVGEVPLVLPSTAGEVRISGRPEDPEQAVDLVRDVVALAKGTPVSAFSLDELEAMTGGGAALEALAADLLRAGLAAVAEAPVDRMKNGAAAVKAILNAGGTVARFTCRGAAQDARPDLLRGVRQLHRATGAVHVFAPLPRDVDPNAPSTGFDDVRMVAIARLFLDEVPSIQVDWSLYGHKLAQVSLLFGADDVDGVSALDDESEGRRRAPLEEIRRNIRAASLVPVERDGRFSVRES